MRARNSLGPLLPASGGSRLWAGPLLALALLLSGCAGGPTAAPFTPVPSPVDSLAPAADSPPGATPVSVTSLPSVAVEVAYPNLPHFSQMVFLTHAGDGTDRVFLVLQLGQVFVFPNEESASSAQLFLDIRRLVSEVHEEEGLLGLAFDPAYMTSGFFYVFYTAANPRRSVVSRFSVLRDDPNRADPSSERVILEMPKSFGNHNGGTLAFGPDGHLYISVGDGGGAGDPFGHGQDLRTLFGKILRIDPQKASAGRAYSIPTDNPFFGISGVRKEIWAYGLRNPWRFSFDRETGLLWAGDVGQARADEIDLIQRGRNYGWNVMEGLQCYPPHRPSCKQEGLEPPIMERSLTEGHCALIGGYVYRGSRLPMLSGSYIYGDYCSGRIWALRYDGKKVTDHALLASLPYQIYSFGEDQSQEVYILSSDHHIYRLKEHP